MGHRRASSADSDLDDIWYYVAKESGSPGRAELFVRAITDRFYLLLRIPTSDARAMICAPGCAVFLSVAT
jgi:plasmid stabilization system protein ParE